MVITPCRTRYAMPQQLNKFENTSSLYAYGNVACHTVSMKLLIIRNGLNSLQNSSCLASTAQHLISTFRKRVFQVLRNLLIIRTDLNSLWNYSCLLLNALNCGNVSSQHVKVCPKEIVLIYHTYSYLSSTHSILPYALETSMLLFTSKTYA